MFRSWSKWVVTSVPHGVLSIWVGHSRTLQAGNGGGLAPLLEVIGTAWHSLRFSGASDDASRPVEAAALVQCIMFVPDWGPVLHEGISLSHLPKVYISTVKGVKLVFHNTAVQGLKLV